MEEKALGKIEKVRVGLGGYQDVMFGISFTLSFDGYNTNDFKGFFSPSHIKHSERTKWTEADRVAAIADAFLWLDKLMHEAKVNDVQKLVGKPIEVTSENNTMKSWRILTEVL